MKLSLECCFNSERGIDLSGIYVLRVQTGFEILVSTLQNCRNYYTGIFVAVSTASYWHLYEYTNFWMICGSAPCDRAKPTVQSYEQARLI
ncbi:unnamed protein product [Ixodes pacificus]